MSAKPQQLKTPGTPAKVHLEQFSGSGTGKTSVKLSQLVPAKAHVEVATKMASTIEAGAQKQKMKMSMDMKVDMKPLK